jgi:starch synthase
VRGFDGRNLDDATGFLFDDPSAHALAATVLYAQSLFFHTLSWRRLMRNGMAQDFSWERSSAQYDAVYRRAREVRGLSG